MSEGQTDAEILKQLDEREAHDKENALRLYLRIEGPLGTHSAHIEVAIDKRLLKLHGAGYLAAQGGAGLRATLDLWLSRPENAKALE